MSASSKKKLRAEENAAKLTEKQIAQNKEDRKTRLYTIGFAVVLVVLIVTAAVVSINRAVANSGSRERKTVAVMMGDETMSNEELGYYFIDTVNSFYSQNASYLSLFGLDTSKALNQQIYNEETGETWADYFMNSAAESARAIYAVCREAAAQGYTLPQENEDQIATAENNIGIYAGLYGYSKPEDYLKAMYGKGASMEGYKNYLRDNMTAQTYQETYQNGLTFTADEINAKDALDPTYYNSYSFNQYYLSTALYLDDAATNEEKAAAAEKDANSLIGEDIGSVADLDAAIAALAVNADTDAASTAMENARYNAVNSVIAQWVSDSSRKEGDKVVLPSTSTTTDEAGNEETTVSGYYVVYFLSATDNRFPLVNVRHILAGFEGGTTDEQGNTTYSDEEKAAARKTAEDLLSQWKQGEATEESFAALATEKTTDPGSKENGGLYENVYPGQMVSAFNNWCFDESRKPGDTGIVETSYGYHVMYFVGQSEETYRAYLIKNDLRSAAYEKWYNGLVEAVPMTMGDTRYIRTDLVMNTNG